MRRHLFDLATLASLLLLAAVLVLWVRSYVRTDVVVRSGGAGSGRIDSYVASSSYGSVNVEYRASEFSPDRADAVLGYAFGRLGPPGPAWRWDVEPAGPAATGWRHALRSAGTFDTDRTTVDHQITLHDRGATVYTPVRHTRVRWQFPLWVVALPSVALPTVWVVRQRRRRRRDMVGRCRACGYDLRATPERCPECGAAGGRRTAPA